MQDTEKTKAELIRELSGLRASEERYRRLFENANDAIATFTVDGIITSVNRGAERLLGYSRAELIGQHVRKVATPASVALAEKRARRWLAGEKLPPGFEAELVRKDGSVVPVEAWTRAMRDPAGNLVGFQGIYRDLTERRRVEAALRASEATLRAVFESSQQAFILLDPQRVIRTFNRVARERGRRLYGRELREGESVYGYVRPEDRPAFDSRFGRALHGEIITVERPVRGEGSEVYWFEFTYSPVFTEDRQCLGVCLGIVDITGRKQAEEALRRSEHYFRSLIEHALDVITIVNGDGTVRYVSPSAERVLGYAAAAVVGRSGLEFVHPGDAPAVVRAFARVTRRPERLWCAEYRVRHRDGTWRVLEAIGRNLLRDPAVAGVVINSRDVTERKEAEAALRHATAAAEAANRAKSEFLATMSHELRTPLGVIIGYTSMLLEEFFGQLGGEQVETLRRVDTNARELLDLIAAVLDMSRLEAGRLPVEVTRVDVAALLRELQAETQGLQDQSGLTFRWDVDEPLPALWTDPGKLKIIVKNLLSNAVKFTGAGAVAVAACSRDGGVEICVRDTGVGIPREALALIFEPFRQLEGASTRHSGGTGLGLHIVKRLLALLGGTVTVESEVGRGSTFRVWLPSLPQRAAPELSSSL
jgi:PAS domain S-box-containing protein